MSAPIFTWLEDWNSEEVHKPRNFSIQFGDGYVERAANGLNTDLPQYNANFTARSATDKTAIMAFLQTTCQAGVIAFQFQPYADATASLWTCNDFKAKPVAGGYYDITCIFQQVVA